MWIFIFRGDKPHGTLFAQRKLSNTERRCKFSNVIQVHGKEMG
jgi:hypothetical protein